MRRVTGRAPFGLDRSVFVCERSLLISVAFDTCRVSARRQSGLLEFKASVRIVAVTAAHHPLQHFVMEGSGKLRFNLAMATRAELRVVLLQHPGAGEPRLFRVRGGYQSD